MREGFGNYEDLMTLGSLPRKGHLNEKMELKLKKSKGEGVNTEDDRGKGFKQGDDEKQKTYGGVMFGLFDEWHGQQYVQNRANGIQNTGEVTLALMNYICGHAIREVHLTYN